MDHYIIKIYRKKSQTIPQQIVGTVENLADQQCRYFHSADELVAILGQGQGGRQETILDHRRNPDFEPNE
ncbi:MAG: hypothetical protein V3S33_06120 [Gammaproteobacteria bacterium]